MTKKKTATIRKTRHQRAVRAAAKRLLIAVDRMVAAADATRRARVDLDSIMNLDQEISP